MAGDLIREDGLSPDERQVLAACTVFEGGFTGEAVACVVGAVFPSCDLAAALAALIARSLLARDGPTPDGSVRYGWAGGRRDNRGAASLDGEAGRLIAAHADYYLAAARRWTAGLDGGEAAQCAARLAAERDNLAAVHHRLLLTDPRRACEAALLLAPVLTASAGEAERLERLDSAVALADSIGDRELGARARHLRAQARIRAGRLDEALADLGDAQAACAPASALAVRLRLALGIAYDLMARPDLAEGAYAEALESPALADDPSIEATIFYNLGALRRGQGLLQRAEEHFARALALCRGAGLVRLLPSTLLSLGQIAHARGDFAQAAALFDEALTHAESARDDMTASVVLVNLAVLQHDQARLDEAAATYDRALERTRRVGNRRYEAIGTLYRGLLAADLGQLREARGRIERAVPLLEQHHLLRELTLGQAYLAALDYALGRVEGVRSTFTQLRLRLDELRDGPLTRAVGLLAGAVGAGGAVPAAGGVDPAERLDGGHDVRIARRIAGLLAARRAASGAAGPASPPTEPAGNADELPHLRVDRTRAHIRLPDQRVVDLSRHGTQWRLLEALVAARLASPGIGQPVARLFAHVWPDERVLPGTETNRVYVAVAALRRMGLREWIRTSPEGYLLDPALSVVLARLDEDL